MVQYAGRHNSQSATRLLKRGCFSPYWYKQYLLSDKCRFSWNEHLCTASVLSRPNKRHYRGNRISDCQRKSWYPRFPSAFHAGFGICHKQSAETAIPALHSHNQWPPRCRAACYRLPKGSPPKEPVSSLF